MKAFSTPLATPRLQMVAMGPNHRDFVFRHFSDPEVARYLVDAEPVRTQADADEIVAFYEDPDRRRRSRWVVLERPALTPIGTIGLHAYEPERRKVEIGYDLAPNRWGVGLMAEAVGAVLDHAFDTLGVHRVEAFVHVDNIRSARLLGRLGFTREGTVRAMYFSAGSFHDHDWYSLLATDR